MEITASPERTTEYRMAQLAKRGLMGRVRPPRGRFAPTVHGPGDRGFIASFAELARRSGVAGYIDEGANRWPAVHRLDAAALVRIAVESPASGPVVHAVGE